MARPLQGLAARRAASAKASASPDNARRAQSGARVGGRKTCYDAVVAFARWDPFRDLLTLQERIDGLSGEHAAGWAPPVDLYETSDYYEVVVEVPGLSRDQIQIHVQDGMLTIEGERRSPDVPCEQYHRVERGHGRFSRSFELREPIQASEINADLRDGVLTISVPKAPHPETRRIPVR